MRRFVSIQFVLGLLGILCFNLFCHEPNSSETASPYLNHSDTVSYVGKETCRNCHPGIYESFLQTGMGQSFGMAIPQKSAADFTTLHVVRDSIANLNYYAHWVGDSMYITEFRLLGKDTIHKRSERVDYIIGSGQHTNSHLTNINGFLYQLPLTWYSQKGKWDLPPGFEKGRNVRFSRAIEFECMSCHNAIPKIEAGSVNRFVNVPNGIDCERCHGPGGAHVALKLKGEFIDTANQIDYSIVNPRKLSWQKQIDLCQRCHLQGNAVLKPGKEFVDFKPGMNLNDVVEVFIPKYDGGENEFIMASHAQRLQESKCFIESNKTHGKEEGKSFETLKLTCITCHNPHVSVKVTGNQVFNQACFNCHQSKDCTEEEAKRKQVQSNCVSCHMPKSGAIDIPHVNVHDHKIRIPVNAKDLKAIKKFAGIMCVNRPNPEPVQRAKGYINYYEKFEGEPQSLDSAQFWIKQMGEQSELNALRIHLLYLKNDWSSIVRESGVMNLNGNQDPWVWYRIGQAYQNLGEPEAAKKNYEMASNLAPFNLDFRNKLGAACIQMLDFEAGIANLNKSLEMQPKQADAWVNLGFAWLNKKENLKALNAYNKAILLDPDHQQGRLNRAAFYLLTGDKANAKKDLLHVKKLYPNLPEVKYLLKQIESE